MSVQRERLEERAHCQSTLLSEPSPSDSPASNRVPSQPRAGETVTVPGSSTSVTVTVRSRDPDRPPSSVAVTVAL